MENHGNESSLSSGSDSFGALDTSTFDDLLNFAVLDDRSVSVLQQAQQGAPTVEPGAQRVVTDPFGVDSNFVCFGAALKQSDSLCTPNFVRNQGGFRKKLCDACKTGSITIPKNRVVALRPEAHPLFANRGENGVWTTLPMELGALKKRTINHTKGCTGPQLVVLRESISASLDMLEPYILPELPAAWLWADGHIHLRLSKGTFVPIEVPKQRLPTAHSYYRRHR